MAGSIATVIECLFNGILVYDDAITLGITCFIGAYLGIKGVYVLIRLFKR